MHTVSRRNIHIEQCDSCHGIFLDRGELEQILASEQQFYDDQPAPPPYQPPAGQYVDSPAPYGRRSSYRDSPAPYHGGYPDSPGVFNRRGTRKRKRRSFLEELFD